MEDHLVLSFFVFLLYVKDNAPPLLIPSDVALYADAVKGDDGA